MELSTIINAKNMKITTGILGAATLVSLAVDFFNSSSADIEKDLDDLATANNPVDAFNGDATKKE